MRGRPRGQQAGWQAIWRRSGTYHPVAPPPRHIGMTKSLERQTKGREPKEVCVCLRLDDYTTTTPMGVVRELAAILERHHATCLFGVIPFCQKASETGERVLEPLSGPMADLLYELV